MPTIKTQFLGAAEAWLRTRDEGNIIKKTQMKPNFDGDEDLYYYETISVKSLPKRREE